MKAVLIPIKNPLNAKQRLAPLLNPEERATLAWTMFEDVVNAIAQSDSLNARSNIQVVLVTNSEPAAKRAAVLGWEVLWEKEQRTESASVDWASSILAQRGFEAVLRIPTDVPLVRSGDIEKLLGYPLTAPAALVSPSQDGRGTNAILRNPPDAFASHFGPDSLSRHREAAQLAGAAFQIVRLPRLALDIDEPKDVLELMRCHRQTLTQCLLHSWGIAERLAQCSSDHDLFR